MAYMKKLGLKKSKDGRSKNPLYAYWKRMMEIAYDRETNTKVHEPWWDFWEFVIGISDIYEQRKGNIFCRIDASGDWIPGNVWFVKTESERVWGRKGAHHIECNGVLLSVSQAYKIAKHIGIDVTEQTIRDRARNGNDIFGKKYKDLEKNFNLKSK